MSALRTADMSTKDRRAVENAVEILGAPAPRKETASGGRGALRTAPAPGGRAARHLARAVVAQVGDLGAASRIGIRHAQRRALVLTDLFLAVVTNEDGF